MALAYRCDQCNTYHDGQGFRIEWSDRGITQHVTLCPECAAVPKEYLRGMVERVYTTATV